MTRIAALLFFLFCSVSGYSQNPGITSILKNTEEKLPYYEMVEAGSWILYLPMEFGKSNFSSSQENAINKLKNANIAEIDLVYSDYPAGQDFSVLTKKRLESLEKLLPSVFNDPNIHFKKIRQTIAKTKASAQGLQHGFFIYFRPKPTKAKAKEEVEKLSDMLKEPGKGSKEDFMEKIDTTTINWCGTSTIIVDTSFYFGFDTLTLFEKSLRTDTNWVFKKMSVKDFFRSDTAKNWYGLDKKDYESWDSLFYITYDNGDCPTYDVFMYQNIDSTVSTVFKRHKWERAMVIADVTGSMYPYTGQLLKWLAITQTDKQKRHFVFFNDGDDKDDAAKVIGKTGGIYSVFTNSYDEVEAMIKKTMVAGSGGDAPENNIEALIESGKLCADCDSIVMIADNWAPVKDISLLAKYNKPVKVVLCGVLGSINKDYLKLVRDTKGSLHLIEEDIYNLSEVKEDQTIKIHGVNYKLIKGEFVTSGSLTL